MRTTSGSAAACSVLAASDTAWAEAVRREAVIRPLAAAAPRAASFIIWLAPEERRLLARLAVGWEHPAGEVLRATIAQVENAPGRSGSRGTLRPAA